MTHLGVRTHGLSEFRVEEFFQSHRRPIKVELQQVSWGPNEGDHEAESRVSVDNLLNPSGHAYNHTTVLCQWGGECGLTSHTSGLLSDLPKVLVPVLLEIVLGEFQVFRASRLKSLVCRLSIPTLNDGHLRIHLIVLDHLLKLPLDFFSLGSVVTTEPWVL